MRYTHHVNCLSTELPKEAATAGGSLDDRVVSGVLPSTGMTFEEGDLRGTGIFFSLREFLKLNPKDNSIKQLPTNVAIYQYKVETDPSIHSLPGYQG